MRGTLIAIVTLATLAGPARAQDSTTVPSAPKSSCFTGRPLPFCRSHWITEASYLARLTKEGSDAGYYDGTADKSASLELGYLVNVSPKVGLGVSASANIVDGVAFVMRSRFRYWLGTETSLDFAPGLVVAGLAGTPRLAADLSVMHHDTFGLTLQTFVVPQQQYLPGGQISTRDRLAIYAGIKLGSTAGAIGAGADALAFLAVLGLYLVACGSHGCD